MRYRTYSSLKAIVVVLSILFAGFVSNASSKDSPEQRLKALGIELPAVSKSVANYQPAIRSGNLVFLSGSIAKGPNNQFIKGKLGKNFTVEEGYQTARLVSISLLAALLSEIDDLDQVERIVKVEGFVNCTPDFEEHSLVINGCSDLFVDVFKERGRHSRIAIGASSLPFGAPVEISAIVEIKQ